jgi:hypothetical protein
MNAQAAALRRAFDRGTRVSLDTLTALLARRNAVGYPLQDEVGQIDHWLAPLAERLQLADYEERRRAFDRTWVEPTIRSESGPIPPPILEDLQAKVRADAMASQGIPTSPPPMRCLAECISELDFVRYFAAVAPPFEIDSEVLEGLHSVLWHQRLRLTELCAGGMTQNQAAIQVESEFTALPNAVEAGALRNYPSGGWPAWIDEPYNPAPRDARKIRGRQ